MARALAHNNSEQTKKLLFLWNNLHLRTHSLSKGRLTLWRWLCGLASWLVLPSWLLEWSPGPDFVGPRFCSRFLRCLALGDLRFLLPFFLALLLLIPIALVGFFTSNPLRYLRLASSLLLLGGRFPTSRIPLCRGLCFCSLTLLNSLFLLQRQRLRTKLLIGNPKGNTTVCPVGLLVPITRLVQFRSLCQDVVQLILHSVDQIKEETPRRYMRESDSMDAILDTRSG